MNDDAEQTNLRLPRRLKVWLRQQAEAARRSFSAEVTFRLEDSRQRQTAVDQSAQGALQ